MTRIKICGNTNSEDAILAKESGANFLGLIFTESKRKVSIEQAKVIIAAIPNYNSFVGVFANQPKELVEKIVTQLNLNWVQFHGDETSRYCDYFTHKKINVIKTFRVQDVMSLKRLEEYDIAAFLFDTFSRHELGGTGQTFDWSVIEKRPYIHGKLFLAGGLTVQNVAEAIRRVHPYAVDVASGIEQSPGKKDPKLLKEFIQSVKESG